MRNEIQAEIERLRSENERLRKWLERIADAGHPYEVCDAAGWAALALAGEPA